MAITKINTPELLDINTTGAKQLPSGTTAQRPTTGLTAGDFRYNTTDNRVEYYDGTSPYDAAKWFQIDDEALPAVIPVGSEHFNVNTYFGNGATQIIDAKFNEAANFNGSSSKIKLPDNIGTPFSTASAFAISAWINLSASGTNYNGRRFVYFIGKKYMYLEVRANNTLNGVVVQSNSQVLQIEPTTILSSSVWYNVVFTGDSNGGNIYLNGASIGNDSWDGTFNSTALDNSIGCENPASSALRFQGKIDQVRIYDSVLSQSAVTALQLETTTTASSLSFPSGETALATYQLDGNGDDISGAYSAISTTDIEYTGMKFQPDWVWIKRKSSNEDHALFDSVRGIQRQISSNLTAAGYTTTNAVSSFDSNGFTTGNNGATNALNQTYAAWNWKAAGFANAFNVLEGGTVTTSSSAATAGITAGTITTGWNVSANRDAGFSIVNYTANGTSGATIGHGLSQEADLVIVKNTNLSTQSWNTYVKDVTDTNAKYLMLNSTNAINNTANPRFIVGNFSSDVFSVGNDNATNGISGTDTYIAYCFHSVAGYSKVDSYQGGQTLNTANQVDFGFAPAFVLIKNTTDSGSQWMLFDDKRTNGYALFPNRNVFEEDYSSALLLSSQGLEFKSVNINVNKSGSTYIFMAIAS